MANVKATDLIDFTRASEGYALAKVSYGEELVENGTFDSDASGWTVNGTGASVSVDNGVATVTRGTNVSGITQQVSLTVGSIYRLQGTVGLGTASSVAFRSGISGWTSTDYANVSGAGTYEVIFVATSSSAYVTVYGGSSSGDTFTADNISVKEVTFNQADGTLQLFPHPDDIPRIEYDADGNLLGLLIEEQRTNNITNSESCSFVDKSGGTVTASTTPAPYGTSSTVKRIQSSTLNGGGRLQVTILTGGDNYCSVYVRSRTGADQNLKITAAGTTGATQVAPASGDWVRLGRVASLGAGSRDMRVLSTGDTIDLDIALPQVELGSFPTSYIKTTGSTASRSADVAKIDVDQFGYNQNEGTVVAEFDSNGSDGSDYPRVFALSNTSGSDLARFLINPTNTTTVSVITSSSGVALTGWSGSISPNTAETIALAIKQDSFAASLSGASTQTDASGNMPAKADLLAIGTQTNLGNNYLNGHIKSIKYYPRRLSDAQLVELTS